MLEKAWQARGSTSSTMNNDIEDMCSALGFLSGQDDNSSSTWSLDVLGSQRLKMGVGIKINDAAAVRKSAFNIVNAARCPPRLPGQFLD